jgi:hypothetical protein
MIRQVATLTLALCAMSAQAAAQTMYTVREPVDVHQAPVTSSPIIGRALTGRPLELTRDVGDWAQVTWADAPDGTAYVRVRRGSVLLSAFHDLTFIRTTVSPAIASAAAGKRQDDEPEPEAVAPTPAAELALARDALDYRLPPHTAGVGIRMDPRFREFGGAARLWTPFRVGTQLEVLRSSMSSELAGGRLTTWQFSPAVLYALPDVLRSSVWVRPFVGTGLDLTRSRFNTIASGGTGTDTAFGTKVFGGAEVTLPAAPQMSISADVGYRWLESSFSAFEMKGVRTSVSAHWFLR